jgi:hypothetical protein
MSYDPGTPAGQVRLLINDTSNDPVFDDEDVSAFLTLEGGSVKKAAAQALDVIADDEVLTAKVMSSSGDSTNGAAVADSLRKRAATLREQAVYDVSHDDDEAFFEIIPMGPTYPTLVEWWNV